MSNAFHLSESESLTVHPLPGYALLRVLPPSLTSDSGKLFLPEKQTEVLEQGKAARRGEVVRVNKRENKNKTLRARWGEEDMALMRPGAVVYYLGHLDEAESGYVIVLHGQILAVEEQRGEERE